MCDRCECDACKKEREEIRQMMELVRLLMEFSRHSHMRRRDEISIEQELVGRWEKLLRPVWDKEHPKIPVDVPVG